MRKFSMHKKTKPKGDWRTKVLRGVFIGFGSILIVRLFMLQVVDAGFYQALAAGQHSFYRELFAERGDIFVRDWADNEEYIAATNTKTALVYAEPVHVIQPEQTARLLAAVLEYEVPPAITEEERAADIFEGIDLPTDTESETEAVEDSDQEEKQGQDTENPYEDFEIMLARLSKEGDPYEPIARGVHQDDLDRILALELPGIGYVLEESRTYPENGIGGHVFGFLGRDAEGQPIGQYGVEGYLNDFLGGVNGYLDSVTDPSGRWIGVGGRAFEPAVNGGDILLTIDRTIQHKACQALQDGVERYQADGGSVVIMEPATGRILAMCNVPDFSPNTYNEVEQISDYNNQAVLHAYEPGSIFKPLIMAAGIDLGAITPTTIYTDTGEEKIDEFTIRNSDKKAYGIQSMTEVLEQSLNTGMIFAMREMGMEPMRDYIQAFGFGKRTGIDLPAEAAGNISSLDVVHEIFYATASYGQGITATPVQLTAAYAALANGGELMRPYIVEEKRHTSGFVETASPEKIRRVVSKKTASTVGAMMVQVIENGHGNLAAVPGYYLAGKTGTAQVVREGTNFYDPNYTKASFAGYGPVDNPQFAMVVMLDHPQTSPWASGTAAPIWGEIADFMLQYFEIAPTRITE